MKTALYFVFILLAASSAEVFRPPAVPLIVFDPYISIWSFGDKLTDAPIKQWFGRQVTTTGFIRIDGNPYQFMGYPSTTLDSDHEPVGAPILSQTAVRVDPTTTTFTYEQDGVALSLIFTTPLLHDDWDLLSKPISYVTFQVQSTDSDEHNVEIYFGMTGEIAVNDMEVPVEWSRSSINDIDVLQIGKHDQHVVDSAGDRVGIDWGYAYLAVSQKSRPSVTVIGNGPELNSAFVENGLNGLPRQDIADSPRKVNQNWPTLAVGLSLTARMRPEKQYILFAYDDIISINYFDTLLPPYWRRDGATPSDLIVESISSYESVMSRCLAFDKKLVSDLTAAGGPKYAAIAALSYRQVAGACKLTWHPTRKEAWYFMKEMSSDGDLSTVDVIWPASPFYFYLSPKLLERMLVPLLVYSDQQVPVKYKYDQPFAPHHLGQWPIADIVQKDQEDMPVEETGNMLTLIYGVIQRTNDLSFLKPFWPLLQKWADYLEESALDPEDQLCTDDFEGPMPHNVNLAAKGILGLAAYGRICGMAGNKTCADKYESMSKSYAHRWVDLSYDTGVDPPHSRLGYDQKNSWSLKYNVAYQRLLGLDTFPEEVIRSELAFYRTVEHAFGIPLDSRGDLTKLDFLTMMAVAGSDAEFEHFFDKVYRFAHVTPDRYPLTDEYLTSIGTLHLGFIARSVLGAVYSKMAVPAPEVRVETF